MKRYSHFGKVIRELRATNQLTQAQLGKFLKLHSQAVSNCERGRAGLPMRQMQKLAGKYGSIALKRELRRAIMADRSVETDNYLEMVFRKCKFAAPGSSPEFKSSSDEKTNRSGGGAYLGRSR